MRYVDSATLLFIKEIFKGKLYNMQIIARHYGAGNVVLIRFETLSRLKPKIWDVVIAVALKHYFCAPLLKKNGRKLPIVRYNQTHFNEIILFSWLFSSYYHK